MDLFLEFILTSILGIFSALLATSVADNSLRKDRSKQILLIMYSSAALASIFKIIYLYTNLSVFFVYWHMLGFLFTTGMFVIGTIFVFPYAEDILFKLFIFIEFVFIISVFLDLYVLRVFTPILGVIDFVLFVYFFLKTRILNLFLYSLSFSLFTIAGIVAHIYPFLFYLLTIVALSLMYVSFKVKPQRV